MERERDDALREIEFVVKTCLESRQIEPSKQAVWLRDTILTRVDPLMIITQRIKERDKESCRDEGK